MAENQWVTEVVINLQCHAENLDLKSWPQIFQFVGHWLGWKLKGVWPLTGQTAFITNICGVNLSWYFAFTKNCVVLFLPWTHCCVQEDPSSFFSKYIAALCSFGSGQGRQLWLPSSCQTNSANGHWRLYIGKMMKLLFHGPKWLSEQRSMSSNFFVMQFGQRPV